MRSTRLPSWIERLAGLDPVPVPPHAFAVSPERLDYARCERQGAGFAVKTYRSVEVPPESFAEGLLGGPLKDPRAFREGLAGFVASLDAPVKAASLVVPDGWLRLAFTDLGDLPAPGEGRDEVLRWKLKRLVPFRVEDLRVQGVEVHLPADGEEERRLLIAFGLEVVLAQLEEAFAAAGVAIGQIGNVSLSLLGALSAPANGALQGLLVVEENGAYSLVFGRGEEPLLYRYKATGKDLAPLTRGQLVERDLRLTRNFLEEQLGLDRRPGVHLSRVVLAAPPEMEPRWLDWLAAGLGGEVEALSARHLPEAEGIAGLPLIEVAPLLGAASREVA